MGLMEAARWAVGGVYALTGIVAIIAGVTGTANHLYLGMGIFWLLGAACWPLGILRHRRRQRRGAIKTEKWA